MKDYYKIFGVKRNASEKEIKKAYFILARQKHPDKQGTETHDAMAELATIKDVLLDNDKRAKYDRVLALSEADLTDVTTFAREMKALGGVDLTDIHSQMCGSATNQVSIDKRLLVAFGQDLRLLISNNAKESIDEQHKSLAIFFTDFGRVGGLHIFSLYSLLSHFNANGLTITNRQFNAFNDMYNMFESTINESVDYNATRAVCRDMMSNAAKLTSTALPTRAPAPATAPNTTVDSGTSGIVLKGIGCLVLGAVLAGSAVGIMTTIASGSIILGGIATVASAAALLGYSSSFGPFAVCGAMGIATALATNSFILGVVAGVGMAAAMVVGIVLIPVVLINSVTSPSSTSLS